ncbi:hypothetical protein VSX62_09790 [Aurantimonas sp. C2-3-R2]|nr:hypothetical protein [Aurantimonas sp. C2-3-R2]
MAEGTHYALDNLLLDPLLVCALLIRDRNAPQGVTVTFAGLGELDTCALQKLANAIQDAIPYPVDAPAGLSPSHYQGGITLEIRAAHQKLRGHKVEELLVAAFPALRVRFETHCGGFKGPSDGRSAMT